MGAACAMPQSRCTLSDSLCTISRSHLQLLMGAAGIKTISYVGGKVTVEPLKLEVEERTRAKEAGALYFPKTAKLTLRPKGTDDIYQQVLTLLEQTLG